AGWSSSVARWAHNPEVAGSNPAPATRKLQVRGLIAGNGGRAFLLDGSAMAAGSGLTVRQLVREIGRRCHRDGSGDRLPSFQPDPVCGERSRLGLRRYRSAVIALAYHRGAAGAVRYVGLERSWQRAAFAWHSKRPGVRIPIAPLGS